MAETGTLEVIALSSPDAVLTELPKNFLFTDVALDEIQAAKSTIAEIEASIVPLVARQQAMIDEQQTKIAAIQEACRHQNCRLMSAVQANPARGEEAFLSAPGQGICLDCGKQGRCCPRCASPRYDAVQVGRWWREDGDYSGDDGSFEKFHQLGGQLYFANYSKPWKFFHADCLNPDCQLSWYWVEKDNEREQRFWDNY